jgi:formylglycine-generating enzyme required for sulfatase activity
LDKRYQVFVSSTYKDLKEERQCATEAVLKAKCFPVGMERFPAGKKMRDYIRKLIEESDIYLLIVGGCYGAPMGLGKKKLDECTDEELKDKISYTEWEYDIAQKQGLPILAHFHENPENLPACKVESRPVLKKKLEIFKRKVESEEEGGRSRELWTTGDKLAWNVESSLRELIGDLPNAEYPKTIGWVRADQVDGGEKIADAEARAKQLREEAERKEAEKLHKDADDKVKEIERREKDLACKESHIEAPHIVIPSFKNKAIATITNSIGMEFLAIPAGEFWMGAADGDTDAQDDEKPLHRVIISKPFFLGRYPVTQREWTVVMGNNPSDFKGKPNHPVENISWNDAQEFIGRLNRWEPGNRYRLPTEAEWEYACRDGTTTRYSFGDGARQLEKYAWYKGNAKGTTHPVGEKTPNRLGLHDMHGNVSEWVQDWYNENYYEESPVSDPSGPDTGSHRVLRGGSWFYRARFARVSSRGRDVPGGRLSIGFRLALNSK